MSVLLIIAIILLVLGIFGAFIPGLPGPILTWVGVLCLGFEYDFTVITHPMIWTILLLSIAVTIIDFIAPMWFAKKTGGTKYGQWGAIIGLLIGPFIIPVLGFILGPFLGAFLGEIMQNKNSSDACKVAIVSALAVIVTTGLKLLFSVITLIYVCYEMRGLMPNIF